MLDQNGRGAGAKCGVTASRQEASDDETEIVLTRYV